MGLDQYLTAKVYVGAKYRAVKQNYIEMQDAYGDDKDFADFKECKVYPTHNISEIIYDIGYWRKVNWIHKWFVDNAQGGNDDCGNYEVSSELLDELYSICETILKKFCDVKNDKDKLELIDYINDKLPPQSGCFFGRTELKDDVELDYYRESLYDTMKFIRLAKKYIEKFGADIYYQSSW